MPHPPAMPLLAATPDDGSAGQLAAAAVLAALAFYWLLPKPRGRSVALGVFAALAAVLVFVSWVGGALWPVAADVARDRIAVALFWLFGSGAVVFATMLVVQRNPARGAIAFAFVVLSVCGLFLLLAAPFLMAATVVIYAGAIIVTFLFVLMLSHAGGPSSENDRTREPLLGSLAGFAFAGLVLFTLHQTAVAAAAEDGTAAEPPLPARPVTPDDRAALLSVAEQLKDAADAADPVKATDRPREELEAVLRGMERRLAFLGPAPPVPPAAAHRAKIAAARAKAREVENAPGNPAAARAAAAALRADVVLLATAGDLPARNVATLGYAVYSEHLLAVEMAGTLLLVATIGAVAVAGRRREAAP